MKVSKELVKLNSKILKAKEVLTQRLSKEPDDDDIAIFLDIPVSLVYEAEEANLMVETIENDSEDSLSVIDTYGYEENSYREDILDLKSEIANLSEFDRNLILKRYDEGLTQSQVSKQLGINQVKVSRQEQKILTRLRTKLM